MNLYAYVGNDPVNMTDPSGKCPWCVAGLLSAALEVGIQGAEIALGVRQDFSIQEVAVAGVAGAAAVGLLTRARRLGQAGELLLDAGVSTFDKVASGDEINGGMAMGVLLDVTVGRAVEPLGDAAGRDVAVTIREGEELTGLRRHFPTRRQRHRQNLVEQNAEAAEENTSNQVQTVATEAGPRTVEAVGCVTGLACSDDD